MNAVSMVLLLIVAGLRYHIAVAVLDRSGIVYILLFISFTSLQKIRIFCVLFCGMQSFALREQ